MVRTDRVGSVGVYLIDKNSNTMVIRVRGEGEGWVDSPIFWSHVNTEQSLYIMGPGSTLVENELYINE